jgi:heterodisulfide reductase subunit A
MKVGVYFCGCGGGITDRLEEPAICRRLEAIPGVAYVESCAFLCSADGKQAFRDSLRRHQPDRVVVAACSPREYESTFRQILAQGGLNPYFLQMVNIREQVVWVTEDPRAATEKTFRLLKAAVARVQLHQPLEKRTLDASPDAVVMGAGPAGLKCALALAEAGRKVTLVEKSPVIGGMPVLYEELFPNLECGLCLIEPLRTELMHGPYAGRIECLTLAEVVDVVGYYGNLTVKIRQSARFVDEQACIGCIECIPPCPVSAADPFQCGMSGRNAMSLAFPGALPNVPYLDAALCLRGQGEDCQECLKACPVEGAVKLDARDSTIERTVGAIVLATGASLYPPRNLPELGYGDIPDVYTSLEFERMLAAGGPTGGEIRTRAGVAPRSVAIIQCAGSLDEKHMPYCSGVCCGYALKFNRLIESKLPGTAITHFYKEMVLPGKDGFALWQHARQNPHTVFRRYSDLGQIRVSRTGGTSEVQLRNEGGQVESIAADMVILCLAVVPSESSLQLASLFDLPLDRFGFFEELHPKVHSVESKRRGFYIAGTCQAPMDIRESMSQGMAAAGCILAGLVEGRKLELEPIVAKVDEERCSGCKICRFVCPYKAIGEAPDTLRSHVNSLLCQGCGTCVAACPAGVISGNHFTNEQIFAELEAILE